MRLIRKDFIAENGERFSLLVDDTGLPDFWTTLYLTTKVRASSHETMRAHMNHLVHLHVWESEQGDTIPNRILKRFEASKNDMVGFSIPTFLSISEAQSLGRHCKITTTAARRNLRRSSKKSNVLSMQASHPTVKVPDPTVSVAQQRNRISVIADYIEFVAENLLRQKPQFSECLTAIKQAKDLVLRQRPKNQGSSGAQIDPDRKAPPPEVFNEIMRLVDPECEDNPFTGLVIQRNSLMFRVLFETGMRSGEILQLKVPDIEFSRQLIKVRRRHDDPEDRYRSAEPNAKTQERDIPISSTLNDDLRDYVIKERRKVPGANKHGFLFVSYKGPSKGQPISLIQFSRMVNKVAKDESLAAFIEANGFPSDKAISRHGFRHNFNKRFSDSVDEHNRLAIANGKLDEVISEKKEIEQRMYINGHKSEKSAAVYNLRHTKEKAEELLKKELQEIDNHLREGFDGGSKKSD